MNAPRELTEALAILRDLRAGVELRRWAHRVVAREKQRVREDRWLQKWHEHRANDATPACAAVTRKPKP